MNITSDNSVKAQDCMALSDISGFIQPTLPDDWPKLRAFGTKVKTQNRISSFQITQHLQCTWVTSETSTTKANWRPNIERCTHCGPGGTVMVCEVAWSDEWKLRTFFWRAIFPATCVETCSKRCFDCRSMS